MSKLGVKGCGRNVFSIPSGGLPHLFNKMRCVSFMLFLVLCLYVPVDSADSQASELDTESEYRIGKFGTFGIGGSIFTY